MRDIPLSIGEILQQDHSPLVTCWEIVRRDGLVLGFTDYHADIERGGVTFRASTGFYSSALQATSGLSTDNIDVVGVLDDTDIRDADIQAGLYDDAQISIFMIDPVGNVNDAVILLVGMIGRITVNGQRFIAEIRGKTDQLSVKIGQLVSPLCRARFGDVRCGVALGDYTHTGTVVEAETSCHFTASGLNQVTGYFNHGRISFTSGINDGVVMDVKRYDASGEIRLALSLPSMPLPGDQFSIVAGCDKRFETCVNRYNNAINFRGEPHLPGLDRMLETAGTMR